MTFGQEPQTRLRTNIAALTLVQLASYGIPLLTLPFLARTLGVESFGHLALAQVIMSNVFVLTDFGFSWSATRKIAANRHDRSRVDTIFSATWAGQWLITLLCAALIFAIILALPAARQHATVYAAAFTLVLANVLLPVWYFQGLEAMRALALIQIGGRLLSLPVLFILVTSPDDVAKALLVQGGVPLFVSSMGMVWAVRSGLARWSRPNWSAVRAELADGAPLFGSKVAITAYTSLTPVILGAMAGPVQLAHFNFADRLRAAAQAALGPVSQALFPRMSRLFIDAHAEARQLLNVSLAVVVGLSGILSAVLWIAAPEIIALLGGSAFQPAAGVLRWVAPLPLVVGLSNVFGVQVLLANNMHSVFNRIVRVAAFVGLALLVPLCYLYGAQGAAASLLLTELLVTITMAVAVWRHGLLASNTRSRT